MRHRWLLALALLSGCDTPEPTRADPVAPEPPVAAGLGITSSRIDLGTLGGTQSIASDINNFRVIVGSSTRADGGWRAFKWTPTRGMVDLGTLPGHDESNAVAINDDGRILGTSGISGSQTKSFVVWSPTGAISVLPIPLLPGYARINDAIDFNWRGEVVGSAYHLNLPHEGKPQDTGWLWSPSGGIRDLGAENPNMAFEGRAMGINMFGQVLLQQTDNTSNFIQSYVWTPGRGFADVGAGLPDRNNTQVSGMAINNLGAVAGWLNPPDQFLPFIWTKSRGIRLLPLGGGLGGEATTIDDWGSAFGSIHPIGPVVWPFGGEPVPLSPDGVGRIIAANNFGTAVGVANGHAAMWSIKVTY